MQLVVREVSSFASVSSDRSLHHPVPIAPTRIANTVLCWHARLIFHRVMRFLFHVLREILNYLLGETCDVLVMVLCEFPEVRQLIAKLSS